VPNPEVLYPFFSPNRGAAIAFELIFEPVSILINGLPLKSFEIISIFHQLKLNEFKNLLDLLKLK
jgi:hypothetical protein